MTDTKGDFLANKKNNDKIMYQTSDLLKPAFDK